MGHKVQEVAVMTLKDLLRRYVGGTVMEEVPEEPMDTLGACKQADIQPKEVMEFRQYA